MTKINLNKFTFIGNVSTRIYWPLHCVL